MVEGGGGWWGGAGVQGGGGKKVLPCVLAEEIYRTSIMLDLILVQKVSDGLKAPILPTVNETTVRTKTKSKSIKLY